jgi:hypothetical protein
MSQFRQVLKCARRAEGPGRGRQRSYSSSVHVLAGILAAEGDSGFFLGEDLLPYLVLAIGGALAVGNGLALVRPPRQAKPGELTRAPVGRSVTMLVIGLIAALWAIASLTTG